MYVCVLEFLLLLLFADECIIKMCYMDTEWRENYDRHTLEMALIKCNKKWKEESRLYVYHEEYVVDYQEPCGLYKVCFSLMFDMH